MTAPSPAAPLPLPEGGQRPWIIIDLSFERQCGECPMCERYRHLNHAVGWYCGPVRQDPGEQVPGWKGEAIAGGMPVCQECHDTFYATPLSRPSAGGEP